MKSEEPGFLVFSRTRGRITIRLHAFRMGQDLAVQLSGGEIPHLGAQCLCEYRDGRVISTVKELPEHKEGDLAHRSAERISSALKTTVSLCAGIHLDEISPGEIRDCLSLCEDLVKELISSLSLN